MKHLDDGVLRRMADESLSVRERERQHYQDCERCKGRYAEIAGTARRTEVLLAMPRTPVDVAGGLARLQERIEADGIVPARAPRLFAERWAHRVRRPAGAVAAAAVLVGAIVLTPAGSMAQQFITIFQPNHIAAVQLTQADIQQLAELSNYGTVQLPAKTQATQVPDAAAASAQSGMQVLTPASLPSSVTGSPTYEVTPGGTGSFVFSAARAQSYAAATHQTIPAMPANIDGSTLTVTVQPAVVATYGANGDIPSLVVGQMRTPQVQSSGVSVAELENYILSMPGISPTLAAQIRTLGDLTQTLPFPIVVDRQQAHTVQVQGVDGLAVGDQTGVGSGVIWTKDGVIYGVAGPMAESQVIAIANSLK